MNCIDVLQAIIEEHAICSARFLLIEHFVGVNWRVRNPAVSRKIKNLKKGLVQHSPINQWELPGEKFLSDHFNAMDLVSCPGNVISFSSKVLIGNQIKHMAMMNLHPENGVSYEDMASIVDAVTDGMSGYLLKSGRYYHFYGTPLLNDAEWIKFMAQFLMPTIIVSPRYIGHCLYRGYAALRITTDPEHKPLLPFVCGKLGIRRKSNQIEL